MKNGFLISALLLAVSAVSGCSKETPKNAILIVLDTTRADHLSPYGYERDTTPNLAKFAADSVVFDRAIAIAPWTPPSIAAMITGRYATSHGMMPPNDRELATKASATLDKSVDTVAEILSAKGYNALGITPNPWTSAEFGFGQGYQNYYFRERARAEEITRGANKMLDSVQKDSSKPFFLFIHYLDPHDPYDAPAPFGTMHSGALKNGEYPPAALDEINRYDGELSYLDHHLGTLFESLKKRGLYDSTLIMIVADHGEQFLERGDSGHGYKLFDEEIHVPLIVKVPGRKPERIDYTVSNFDVFATIMDYTGSTAPASTQSVSLLDEKKLLQRPGVLSEIIRKVNWKSFTSLEHKRLIMDFGGLEHFLPVNNPTLVGIFDSDEDPRQKTPINDPDLQKDLRANLDAILQNVLKDRIEADKVTIKDETLEQLRSLGYLK